MSNPTTGIKDLLVAANIGVFGASSGWGIFQGGLPTKPYTAISITASSGLAGNPKYLLDYPSIQVLIRGTPGGYSAAYDKAKNVVDALLGLPSQVINGDTWVQVNQIGSIAELGVDENNCPMFSTNFSLIIEPASSGSYRQPL